jgi:hypothetical protein
MTPFETRIALKEHGYSPIPVRVNKRPYFSAWQTKIAVSIEEMRRWPGGNTGILTKWAPVADLDILDPAAADATEELFKQPFDGIIPVRFGLAPKRALLFQTSQPFSKLAAHFVDPVGRTHKIEILGNGQQLVVAGRHPDTRQDYSWFGPPPWEIRRSDLVEITERVAIALLAAASRLLESQFGFTRTQVTSPAQPYRPQSQYSRLVRPGRGKDYWQRIIDEGTDDGARNDTCAAIAGYLVAIGQSEGYALDELRKWNSRSRPPLPDRVVARTLQSIYRLDRKRHEDRRRDHR